MWTFANSNHPVFCLPGLRHQTLAGRADGLGRLEVWYQALDSGAETPPHFHYCEEVLLIQSGRGRLVVAGEASPFGPDTTLTVAARVPLSDREYRRFGNDPLRGAVRNAGARFHARR